LFDGFLLLASFDTSCDPYNLFKSWSVRFAGWWGDRICFSHQLECILSTRKTIFYLDEFKVQSCDIAWLSWVHLLTYRSFSPPTIDSATQRISQMIHIWDIFSGSCGQSSWASSLICWAWRKSFFSIFSKAIFLALEASSLLWICGHLYSP
jgi:hypothetical protein